MGAVGAPLLVIAGILTLFGHGRLAILVLPILVIGVVWYSRRLDAGSGHLRQIDYPGHLSERDMLTGLLNRRGFFDMASTILTGEQGAILALVELDRVPLIDDDHGRARRDILLQEFAKRLSAAIRQSDVVARWSNEEFVILYTGTTPDEAQAAINRLRKTLARTRMFGSGQRSMDILCGTAPIRSFAQIGDATRTAGEALADARREGRDRISLAG